MSKAKLIELIKMDYHELMVKLNDMSRFSEDVIEFQNMLRLALKEQDRDTRHGCADAVSTMDDHARINTSFGTIVGAVLKSVAHNTCMSYQDKDLEGL